MPAQELYVSLEWQKSRLSHQVRRAEHAGLIGREPNPSDARSVVIRLLPAGRRAIEVEAPQHVYSLRRHLIDLFSPAELDMLAALNERVLRHLAEDPFTGQCTTDG
jgi:DNA-binding MarR family transcriptional regulator